MGKLLRFPTRPSQAVRISRPSDRVWIVDVVSALSAKLWPMRKAFVTDQVLFCSQSLPASGTLHERQS
jgi:hypothetical protein